MKHPPWITLHPRVTVAHLGYLPVFLDSDDQRSAAEQINERYAFGGWQPFGQDKFKLTERFNLLYPNDPPLKPIAMTMLRREMVFLYESDIVAIVQPDRSFESREAGLMKKSFITETTCQIMFNPQDKTYMVLFAIKDIPSEEKAKWIGQLVVDAVRQRVIEMGGDDLGDDEPGSRRDQ